MGQLLRFLRSRWEEILWLGLWIPLVLAALSSGNLPMIGLTVVGGLVSVVVLYSLIERIRTRRRPYFGGEASGVSRRGIVFTVGLQGGTIRWVLDMQKPEYVGLVCSNETLELGREVVAAAGLPGDRLRREIVDPRDIADVRAKAGLLVDWVLAKGVKPEEIAIDPTGGMTPMSLGAFSVAQERNIDCQYLRSRYDEGNRPIPGSEELIFLCRYAAAF